MIQETTLIDIVKTSQIIGGRGSIEKPLFDLLQKGITTIRDYIFSQNFILESAVNSASKAAYLALLIKNDKLPLERFDNTIDLNLLEINDTEFKKFKSIIKFDPEAYYYWYKCIEIMKG